MHRNAISRLLTIVLTLLDRSAAPNFERVPESFGKLHLRCFASLSELSGIRRKMVDDNPIIFTGSQPYHHLDNLLF
jgi:hypothetical protein